MFVTREANVAANDLAHWCFPNNFSRMYLEYFNVFYYLLPVHVLVIFFDKGEERQNPLFFKSRCPHLDCGEEFSI